MGATIEEMRKFRDPSNALCFSTEKIKEIINHYIEGDFHDELKGTISLMDPNFKIESMACWRENLPQCQKMDVVEGQLAKADGEIEKMQKDHNKLLFEADSLALARDASQLASLYRQQQQGERANRLAKVAHLKEQNSIGASCISTYMAEKSKHVAGPLSDLKDEIAKYTSKLCADDSPLIVWLDFMKFGRTTNIDLNNVVAMLSQALTSMPEKSVGFAVAPNLVSERRSGLNAELRRIEDKLEAKSLKFEAVFLRSTRPLLPWTPESQYVVPSAKDALPSAAEGNRALSELQESAQLLTGDALPMAVIEALLAESPKVGEKIAVLNLSPYDACVELVALKWHMDNPDRRIRSLSLSTDMTVVGHTEKTVALALMEARFCGSGIVPEDDSKIVPAEDEKSPAPAMWTSEPETIPALLDKYLVESKFPGKIPGTTLYLTLAEDRGGHREQALPNQKWKLFMVLWLVDSLNFL
ncbi:unnamed protein product [Durusdinium trenchii]|uniref:Uncharacterized protein n=1 Tax=Durusdinium trenchii TaxID=1381693 RepID=A0ABP0QSY7_9DINO